jgi:hypothetical protein
MQQRLVASRIDNNKILAGLNNTELEQLIIIIIIIIIIIASLLVVRCKANTAVSC